MRLFKRPEEPEKAKRAEKPETGRPRVRRGQSGWKDPDGMGSQSQEPPPGWYAEERWHSPHEILRSVAGITESHETLKTCSVASTRSRSPS